MARKKVVADPELAKRIRHEAGIGMPLVEICTLVGLSRETVNRLYRQDYERGKADARSKVRGRLYELCMSQNPAVSLRAAFSTNR